MNLEPWLLDTHIWIRLLNGDKELNKEPFLRGIDLRSQRSLLRIASISLWETAMLAAKGRITLSMPVEDWLKKARAMPGLSVVSISPEIAADSCFLPGAFHGDPADRLITASCRVTGARLITLDKTLLDYGRAGWVKALSPLETEPPA